MNLDHCGVFMSPDHSATLEDNNFTNSSVREVMRYRNLMRTQDKTLQLNEVLKTDDFKNPRTVREQVKTSTLAIDVLNIDVQRDLLNRVKYHRGAALRGPELKD